MPDPTLLQTDRPAIFIEGGPHDYVESEFAQGAGRCDKCGGGPDAAIHHWVDPQERMAVALEEIAGALHHHPQGIVSLLERLVELFEKAAADD